MNIWPIEKVGEGHVALTVSGEIKASCRLGSRFELSLADGSTRPSGMKQSTKPDWLHQVAAGNI